MIGVIGGTGNTGRAVVKALKEKGSEFRCLVRDPEAAKKLFGEVVELEYGDVSDHSSVEKGLEGCEILFLLTGHSPALAEQEIGTIQAAKRAGVNYIVKLSGGDAVATEDCPSLIGRSHWQIEQALKESGLEWTILRPGFFMQNLINTAGMVKGQSKVMMPISSTVKIAMIDVNDTGDVAAEVLTKPGHESMTYFLSGHAYTLEDFTSILSNELGSDIPYLEIPLEAAVKAMKERDMPDWLIDHQSALMGIVNSGIAGTTNDHIANLSGHAPSTLEQFVKNHIDLFKN